MVVLPLVDYRRYLRPFFLDPATGMPSPSKKYYDILSLVVTQLTFSFATAPFLVLSFSGSLQVWARMYFYPIWGTAISLAFFTSPAKELLKQKLEQRQAASGVKMVRSASQESLSSREPVLGVSSDPQRDFSEIVDEIKADVNKNTT